MSDLLIANIGFFVLVLTIVGMLIHLDNSRRNRELDSVAMLLNKIEDIADMFIQSQNKDENSYIEKSLDQLNLRVDRLSREREQL